MAGLKLYFAAAVLACLLYSPVLPASIFTAFSKGFGRQEEASYTSVKQGRGYEERTYDSMNWLCTLQRGGYAEEDQMDVFLRLFDYLGGQNSEGRDLNMAIPVSIEYKKEESEEVFTACFFLETKDQDNFPTPTNKDVFIRKRPKMSIFTRKFGGYATSYSDWMNEAKELQQILQSAGETVKSNIMFWNAYSSPVKFWNRRNEVWFVKDESAINQDETATDQ